MRIKLGLFLLSVTWAAASGAQAQDITPASDTTRFLLTSALMLASALASLVFVFAFGLRDVGLARPHNTPAVCLRMMGLVAVTALAFWICGYNLIYLVEEGGLLGEFRTWALRDDDVLAVGYASGLQWFSQMGLVAMAVAVVSSALSERVRLGSFLVFTAGLAGLVYPIIAGWAWGGGYLQQVWGFYDFGGAGVIHITGGAAALAAAFVVGPRPGQFVEGRAVKPEPSDALPLTAFGAGLLWVCLMLVLVGRVNSFSTIEDAISVGSIMASALLAASGAVLAGLFLTQVVYKRVGLVTVSCAAIGGLVSIAADPLHPTLWQAAMIGAVGGVIVTVAPPFLNRYRIDDAGVVVPTHLLCGIWGIIVVPWTNADAGFLGQLVGAGMIAGFAGLLSMLFWIVLKYTFGARQKSADDQRAIHAARAAAGDEVFRAKRPSN